MLNFTVGPVMSEKEILEVASRQVPYFRTDDFSKIMLKNEKSLISLANAKKDAKVLILTGSGTLSMEASLINTTSKKEKILIINGGSFGQRFCDIAKRYNFKYDEIKLEFGQSLTKNHLKNIDFKKYSSVYVNAHETSSGLLYDLNLIGAYCKKYNLLFVVDAISSFLADEIDMRKSNIDILIIGSQKALALAPGISILILSKKAQEKINKNTNPCFYMDLKSALKDSLRGQTPFTPAVSIILQLSKKLEMIEKSGGLKKQIEKVKNIAIYFRKKISKFNFEIVAENCSNATTALRVSNNDSAKKIFKILEKEYKIWVCPNGGQYADSIFRVGHIGNIKKKDIDVLIKALNDLKRRKIIT